MYEQLYEFIAAVCLCMYVCVCHWLRLPKNATHPDRKINDLVFGWVSLQQHSSIFAFWCIHIRCVPFFEGIVFIRATTVYHDNADVPLQFLYAFVVIISPGIQSYAIVSLSLHFTMSFCLSSFVNNQCYSLLLPCSVTCKHKMFKSNLSDFQ